MSVQNVDKHLEKLKACCRVCAKKLGKGARKTNAKYLQNDIFVLWGQNVALDSPHVHPQFVCNSCRAICANTRYKSGELQVKSTIELWVPHDHVECKVCTSFPKKPLPGRKKKRPSRQSTSSSQQHSTSNTDTASVETECGPDADDQNVAFYFLFMDDLRQSLQRIPSMARKAILKELIEIEEDIDTEGAVRYSQALPVSEQVVLVTSLMNGSSSEELIKGVIMSLPVDSLQLLAYNLLRGQVKDVLRDQQSFSQTYKSIEIVKNIDREAWLQRRNKVVTAVVDGISDGKKSNFQKCVAVEHLYSLADSDQSVLPFSFLVNLLLFTITNSRLAMSVVSKILPGGSYSTVTGWRDGLASVPPPFPPGDSIVAFDNDQIVQRRWKVKVGQKSRVSILTSICQAAVNEKGTLQKREDLAPRYLFVNFILDLDCGYSITTRVLCQDNNIWFLSYICSLRQKHFL